MNMGKLLYVLHKVNSMGLYGEIKDRPSRVRVKRKSNLIQKNTEFT